VTSPLGECLLKLFALGIIMEAYLTYIGMLMFYIYIYLSILMLMSHCV
jgi:hypothetical protein